VILFYRAVSLKDAPVAAERPELSDNVAITSEWQVVVSLGEYRRLKPFFSALIGYVDFLDDAFEGDSYTYWNAGVEVGLDDKFSLDLRYWDTDTKNNDNADERFVGTLSASF